MLKAENAYRTITEVAELLQVPATVLRFWETQFHQIKPMKRMGRRYYQAQDVVLLARIRDYLYKEGYTIKGVQKRLRNSDKTSEPSVFEKEKNNATTDALIREISDIKTSLEDHI